MEPFLIYFIKGNLILAILYLVYIWLFRKETFYRLNRIILLCIILISFSLPFLRIPNLDNPIHSLSNKWMDHPNQMSSKPDGEYLVSDTNWELAPIPLNTDTGEVSTTTHLYGNSHQEVSTLLEWPFIGLFIYGVVASLIFGRFLLQVISITRLVMMNDKTSKGVIYTREMVNPFSFMGFIVVNPTGFHSELYRQVINHEKVHVREWHSLDLILAEIVSIACWFNPFAWGLRKTIRMNLEYIADEEMIRSGVNKKEYQYNLLKLSIPAFKTGPGMYFSQSVLKNRISMMNSKKSHKINLMKYLSLLPFIAALAVFCNTGQAQANDKSASDLEKKKDQVMFDTLKTEVKAHIPIRIKNEIKVIAKEQTVRPIFDTIIIEQPELSIKPVLAVKLHDLEIDTLVFISDLKGVQISPDIEIAVIDRLHNVVAINSDISTISSKNISAVIMPESLVSVEAIKKGIAIQKISVAPKNQIRIDTALSIQVKPRQVVVRPIPTGINFKNIFLVISKNTSMEDLEKIKEACMKAGLDLKFRDVRFTDDGLIEKFSFSANDDLGLSASLSNTFGKENPAEKIFLYRLLDGDDRFGFGANDDFEDSQAIPESIKKMMRETNAGYSIETNE